MAHQKIAFDLLQGIEDDTDEDQEGSTSVEARELVVDAELPAECRQDGYDLTQQNNFTVMNQHIADTSVSKCILKYKKGA